MSMSKIYKGKNLKECGFLNDEALVRKYNAFIKFAKEEMTVSYGAVNYELRDVEYVEKSEGLTCKDYIRITWGEYETIIRNPKRIMLDRKYKLIELCD